jgi:hypothetical protein
MISNGDFYSDLLMEGTNYFDVRFIAGIDNLAKVWVAHSEYTISKNPIAGEQNTIWDCRYESGIPKKRKSVRVWIRLQYLKI